MRAILVVMFFFAFVTTLKAQVSSVTGQYLQDNNILLNPGFESGIGKWTNSAGTFSIDYTNFVQGKASGKIVLSSQALAFTQDSTSYVTALADGVQGLASVYIKSEFPAKVCSRSAGSTVTTNCVDVVGNNKWSLYKVPSILGATSNGISVNTNGTSVTGTIYIDESFVGITDLAADVDASKIAGEAYFAGTIGCDWSRASTVVGAVGSVAACPGPTIVQQNMGSWQTTDSDLPRVTINNLPSGKYKATFTFLSYTSNGNAPVFAINDGSTTCEPISTEQSNAFATSQVISCTFSYSNSGNRVFELYTGISSNTSRILNSYTNPRGSTKFILEYFGSSSVYAATANQNNVDVFSAKINNAGDAVSEENIDWLPATCADADPGESTCTFNSGIFTTAPNCVCAIKNQVSSGDCKITASSTGFTTYNSVATNYEIQVMCQKQGADFTATRLITGQFKELMTVPNVTKPKTCYYAFGGASATLASPTECTTGTCVEVVDTCGTVSAPTWATTAIYQNIIFASGTFANTSLVQCDCVAWDVTTGQDRNCGLYNNGNTTWASNSTGGLNFNALTYNSAGTQSTSFVQLTCQGIAP
jgi:hypothetical protein